MQRASSFRCPLFQGQGHSAAVRFLDEADEDRSSDHGYYEDCVDVMSIGCIGDTSGDSLLDQAAKLDTCFDVHVVIIIINMLMPALMTVLHI